MSDISFVFEDDGEVYAYQEGRVLASARDADELEAKLADNFGYPQGLEQPQPVPPGADTNQAQPQQPNGCKYCAGAGCANCQPNLTTNTPYVGAKDESVDTKDGPKGADFIYDVVDEEEKDDKKKPSEKEATHIITPNGLKGKIVGRVSYLWGDEITARFENGRVAKFDVVPDLEFVNEPEVAFSPYQALLDRLSQIPNPSRDSLAQRIDELKDIKLEAQMLIHNASYIDEQTIDDIVIQASHEMKEVSQAIAALDEEVPYENKPFAMHSASQEALGQETTWLDDVVSAALNETLSQDFDQMMDEQPEVLVADIEDVVIDDPTEVQYRASSFVDSHTVGIDPQDKEKFRKAFLSRVEQARQREVASRQKEAHIQTQKVASIPDPIADFPDESVFL